MKFVFYQSRENTGFIGEAIKNVQLLDDPMKVFEIYGEYFWQKRSLENTLNQERWERKGSKKKRPWMVIELEDIRKYDERLLAVWG